MPVQNFPLAMNSKTNEFGFSKEIENDNFSILLRFDRRGGIRGSFILHDKKGDSIFEISDGMFLSIDQKISFAFSIEWNRSENLTISTCFSGHFKNIEENSYFIDWLTVYESRDKKSYYTKKGEFSSNSNGLIKINRPYPDTTIGFFMSE